jgi:transcriptional regulator with XRE-family HTH domain
MANTDGRPDLGAALEAVGPRLRSLRLAAELTLAQLAAATGISVSTLSRLESGRRKPTLELLLPLAQAHRVPLDELVDAPPTADPRVAVRPVRRGGVTFVPLTRRPGGVQAFKQVIPPGLPTGDELGVHEGYEWFYVMSGRVRLRLGEHDVVLGPGEAAEFDTRVPHRIDNVGRGHVELISLFGPQGERMHVRARPRPR